MERVWARRELLTAAACLPAVARANPPARIKVAAVFSLPFEQLWVSCVHAALRKAQARGDIDYKGFENVPFEQYPRLLRRLAQVGYQLVFGEGYPIDEQVRKVAKDHPELAFVWCSDRAPQAPNFSVFDNHIYEPAYLAGMLAGGLTQRKHLGLIGGFDMPDIRAIMNAFISGAQEIDPKLRFSSGVIQSWFNPVRAKKMAQAMIDQGVDVFLAITHSGVVDTAAENNALAFNCMANQQAQYPKTVVAAVLWHMEPVVDAAIAKLRARSLQAEDFGKLSLMGAKGSSLSPLGSFEGVVPAALVQRVRAREAEIINGKFVVPYNEKLQLSMR